VDGAAVIGRGHTEVVVGPPHDVDVVLTRLLEVRLEGGLSFAERAVDVHRHADGA
jgi:hypothetical protein